MRIASSARLFSGLVAMVLAASLTPLAQQPGPAAPQPEAGVAGQQAGRGGRGTPGARGGLDLTFMGPVLPLTAAEQT